MGLAIPTKRKPGVRLTKEQKENNRVLNQLRSVVERVIALVLHLAGSAYRLQVSVGLVWAGVSSCSWVALLGCGVPLMNNPHGVSDSIKNQIGINHAMLYPSHKYDLGHNSLWNC